MQKILLFLCQCIICQNIFCDNYSMILGGLPNYYRVETNDEDENDNNCNKINKNKAAANKSFKYKTKIIGSTPY